jgi:hypothetical protein
MLGGVPVIESARRLRKSFLIVKRIFGHRGMWPAAVALIWTIAVVTHPLAAASDALTIEVTPQQRVTVIGSGPSLRALLEDICWRSKVELRFEAADSSFAADIRAARLDEALGRLLRKQSFVLLRPPPATTGNAEARPLLHVMASDGIARQSAPDQLSIPTGLLQEAFGSTDPDTRRRALSAIMAGIQRDPAKRKQFLAADVGNLALALAVYPTAKGTIEELSASTSTDPQAQAKLRELAEALGRVAPPSRLER